jgi:hypothetical protein
MLAVRTPRYLPAAASGKVQLQLQLQVHASPAGRCSA